MVFLEALRHMDIEQTIQGHNEIHRQRCDARDPNPKQKRRLSSLEATR
jgi:hypothetical protein